MCCPQMEAVLREGHASREGELCVQEVFSLLDVLHKWVAEGRCVASSAGSAASGGAQTLVRNVEFIGPSR